jgi:hypothetical protein
MSPIGFPSIRPIHQHDHSLGRLFVILAVVSACFAPRLAIASTAVRVSVTPGTASVFSGITQQFNATVTNTSNTAVTWSVTKGKVSTSGLYTAPTVTSTITVTVTATSVADSTKSDTATVSVEPSVGVSISPSSVSLESAGLQHFRATITGTNRLGVTWSTTAGSVASDGTYTAPTVSVNTNVKVTATSVADPLASASAQVTVTPPIALSLSPSSSSVLSSGTQQFTATVKNSSDTGVTWKTTAGWVSSSGLFHAPAVTMNTTAVVTATSQADRTKSSTATVTVTSISSLSITTSSLSSALSGTAYSAALSASGGTPPYNWSISWGALPPGMSLSTSGVISGTTTDTGTFAFTAKVTDSSPQMQKANSSLDLNVNLNLGGQTVPSTLFNFHSDHTSTPWPSSAVAGQRLWDAGVDWPVLNTADGVYDWTLLDQRFSDAASHNADLLYSMGMTPPWAQCGPSTASRCTQGVACAFSTQPWGGGAGQCYWPEDLNTDGTGANQHWKDWVTALATHSVNSSTAHIKYYEIWNEPNVSGFWQGTTAQLVRMAQDAACIIKGIGPGCTSNGIDPQALILTPAPALGGGAINTWLSGYLGAGGAQVTDVIAFHGYNGTNAEKITSLASTVRDGAMTTYNVTSKPMFDTEFSWGENVNFPDPDERASFVGRTMLLHWSAGISRVYWYAWETSGVMWSLSSTTGCTTPDPSGSGFSCSTGIAYGQVESWMVGATLSQPCSATGTVWTCQLTKSGGAQALAVWDTAQTCSNGVCTASTFTVPQIKPSYFHYLDLTGASTKTTGSTVQIGYKPILLENQ